MAITRTRSSKKCTVNIRRFYVPKSFFSLHFSFRIKELELKCSNVVGRFQEREDEYSRKYEQKTYFSIKFSFSRLDTVNSIDSYEKKM